ncbi:MAG TPA: electron transfer flavoprotein subunit alpha/FixB family protein [Chloroflexaceae bacterium]|nr:electron transfer flavoprotein subunit alpha/FixB family protein [Chloroflexaceae bacterium]
MNHSIVVVAERDGPSLSEASLECVEEARDLAAALGGQVHAIAPGASEGAAAAMAAHGADQVVLLEHPALEAFSADLWLAALEAPLRALAPTLVLAPDSGQARSWLPRLALRWPAPIVTRCLAIWLGADGALELTRPAHSGANHERLACPGAPTVLATMAPGARGLGRPDQGRQARVERVAPELDGAATRDRSRGRLPPDPRTVDISEADRVVAGGLGVGSPEGLELLWRLSDALGAAVGGTRVIADRGWLPFERQIGSTGKTVVPQLYIAVGISGASQHTSGMTGSESVVVVNTDRTAPMFGLADLGLVGDMHAIVPEVLRLLGADQEAGTPGDEATAQTPDRP